DAAAADMLHNQSGNYEFLNDGTGRIDTITYGSSTTATTSTAGDVLGLEKQRSVQQGETGTAILQHAQQYLVHTVGSVSTYVIANETNYRNTDGTGAETTSNSDTWFSSSQMLQSVATSLPTVSSGQNGPGSADTATTYNDSYGRPIWTKDGGGFIHYTAYDQATGAVTKTITD